MVLWAARIHDRPSRFCSAHSCARQTDTHRPRYVCCSLVARMHSSHFMLCMRCGLKTEEILTYIVNVIKAERRQHRATAAGHVIQTATRRTAASSDAMPVSCVTLSLSSAQCRHTTNDETRVNKVAHTRLLSVGFWSWSRFFAVSLQVTWVINPAVGCHYFPPGLQLPPQPLRGLLPILLLGEQRHNGYEQFA